MPIVDALKALGNDRRLKILDWLKNPRAHFREQMDGDLVDDGVCGLLIAEKLVVIPKRIKQWTFYRRNEARIAAVKAAFTAEV
jgi:hypothetical protein